MSSSRSVTPPAHQTTHTQFFPQMELFQDTEKCFPDAFEHRFTAPITTRQAQVWTAPHRRAPCGRTAGSPVSALLGYRHPGEDRTPGQLRPSAGFLRGKLRGPASPQPAAPSLTSMSDPRGDGGYRHRARPPPRRAAMAGRLRRRAAVSLAPGPTAAPPCARARRLAKP